MFSIKINKYNKDRAKISWLIQTKINSYSTMIPICKKYKEEKVHFKVINYLYCK